MERHERHRGLTRHGVAIFVATLVAASIGACSGGEKDDSDDGSESGCRRDDDCRRGLVCVDLGGNRNEICDEGESCECASIEPGTGGSGGNAGSSAVGGTGSGADAGEPGVGGTGNATGCDRDEDCPRATVCIDNLDGDGDGFCEAGETCTCATVGSGGGGTSGTGGVGGSGVGGAVVGGTGGRGGGGTGGASSAVLGESCASAAECGQPFVCLASNGLADGSGPPNGLCTIACTSDATCQAIDAVSYCVAFTTTESYCIQGCRGGQVGAPKCRVREDFACGILDTTPTTTTCVSTDTCAVGQVCFEGVCQNMLTACVPMCGGDFDCASGQFCDFTSGFCVPTMPTGLPFGSLCDPTLPAASDPCNGFCQATDETETEGTCTAFCSASLSSVGCGWDGLGTAEAGCLYATVISRDAAGGISLAESDLMLCGQLCDCNADCPAEVELCMDENAADPQASIQAIFGRGGYCRPLLTGETTEDSIATCP